MLHLLNDIPFTGIPGMVRRIIAPKLRAFRCILQGIFTGRQKMFCLFVCFALFHPIFQNIVNRV
jgi:hypothetical protein